MPLNYNIHVIVWFTANYWEIDFRVPSLAKLTGYWIPTNSDCNPLLIELEIRNSQDPPDATFLVIPCLASWVSLLVKLFWKLSHTKLSMRFCSQDKVGRKKNYWLIQNGGKKRALFSCCCKEGHRPASFNTYSD
jgi:hypothetical protein